MDALPTGGTCDHCHRALESFCLDLPFGLGQRTWWRECACAAERREAAAFARRLREHEDKVRQLLDQSGIGLRHRDATFASFAVTPASESVVDVCRAFVAAFPNAGKGLTLGGTAGTGKTHLAVAITRALVERGAAAVIVNVPQLFLVFRHAFQSDQGRRFDELLDLVTRCDHLVLDDLGRERLTEWVVETLYLIVNTRYEDRRATSITTNLDLEGLRARLSEAILDRLAETNETYWCQWPSHRRNTRP